MSFLDKLHRAGERHHSCLCVGLDPMLDSLPAGTARTPEGILAFNRAIISATSDLVCAYKPNLAFYEALGAAGWQLLEDTVRSVPDGIPVIADAKRADIGSTAQAYATAIYDTLHCDACTVNPYLGFDAVAPFIARAGSFAFVLCRTSNPGAGELQDIMSEGVPLYERVAHMVAGWGRPTSCGLVVGATDPVAAARVAAAAPGMRLLVPGLGTQGGDLYAAARALGGRHTIWTVSRAITGAGRGADYAERARAAAIRWRDDINGALEMP